MPYPVPVWLQLLIGVFSLAMPALSWLGPLIVAIYELYMILPWFHKAGFLMELRQAVKAAKAIRVSNPDEKICTQPLEEFHAKWKAHLGFTGVGLATDLKKD